MKYLSVAYYPEVWPEERWERDLSLMRDAGINCVRMGEFNWSGFEPREGEFHFEAYHRILDLCGKYGIRVILCTPTSALPPWMMKQYPDTVRRDRNGVSPSVGSRRQYCQCSERFFAFSRRIVEKMAEAFRDRGEIVVWQLDNELSSTSELGMCCCPRCEREFRRWLREKYGTLEALNSAWNAASWSSLFSDWEEITLPLHRIGWNLDLYRCMSDRLLGFILEHRDILKRANPAWRITTNTWTSFSADIDIARGARELDYYSCDSYVSDPAIAFMRSFWDLYRNLKGVPAPFAVGETAVQQYPFRSGCPEAKAWFWEMVGRGAETIGYFRWRQSVMGEEELLSPSIVPWSGEPGIIYRNLKQIKEEYDALGIDWDAIPLKRGDAAILVDMETAFLHRVDGDSQRLGIAIGTVNSALSALGFQVDVIPMENVTDDLSSYRLIALPTVEHVPPGMQRLLKDYVRGGGLLFAEHRLNIKDEFGKYRSVAGPEGMRDLFGLEIHDVAPSFRERAYWAVTLDIPPRGNTLLSLEILGGRSLVRSRLERLELRTADSLLEYSEGCFEGGALLSENAFGSGFAWYLGADVDLEAHERIFRFLCGRRFGRSFPHLPFAVGRMVRGDFVIYTNCSPEALSFDAPDRVKEVLTGSCSGGKIHLKEHDVCVIRRESPASANEGIG